jgi:hypothetical protein
MRYPAKADRCSGAAMLQTGLWHAQYGSASLQRAHKQRFRMHTSDGVWRCCAVLCCAVLFSCPTLSFMRSGPALVSGSSVSHGCCKYIVSGCNVTGMARIDMDLDP